MKVLNLQDKLEHKRSKNTFDRSCNLFQCFLGWFYVLYYYFMYLLFLYGCMPHFDLKTFKNMNANF